MAQKQEAQGQEKVRLAVLAFSGGLDTSVILRWLQETYDCEVATFTADLGQGEEVEEARDKARALGVKPEHIFIEDLRVPFVADFVYPMLRAGARYEDVYLLGTAIARPLIAQRMVEVARELNADALAHGCTGKGNDQVRFELAFAALAPELRVLAPWRSWALGGRQALLDYAKHHGIPVATQPSGAPSYSMDANLLHVSYEGGALEDPWHQVEDSVWSRTQNPQDAPDTPQDLLVSFVAGDAVALDGKPLAPAALLTEINRLAGLHGVGRLDLVESRTTGMKSRGAYETPGGTALLIARRGLEQITLDREVMRLRDDLMPRYAACVYGGFWFAPERIALQGLVDQTATPVTGEVVLRLFKGSASVVARRAPHSLYSEQVSSFEDTRGAETAGRNATAIEYRQSDAEGFIRLQGLRLQLWAEQQRGLARDAQDE